MYWKGGDIEGQFKHITSLQLIDRNDKSLTVLPVVHQVGTHGHIFPFLLFFFLFFSLKTLEVVRVTDTKSCAISSLTLDLAYRFILLLSA